jgi:hypothetical protein
MVETPTIYEALLQAIDALGSQSELARVCKVSPTAVWKWVQSSKRLPGNYVLQVEAATGVPAIICVLISILLISRPARAGMAPING